jgi:hypothetical protein
MQPIQAIARQVDDEPGLGQALSQVIPGFDLVFDHQYFHVHSPVLRFAPFCAGNMGNPARLQKCNLAVSMALGELAQNSFIVEQERMLWKLILKIGRTPCEPSRIPASLFAADMKTIVSRQLKLMAVCAAGLLAGLSVQAAETPKSGLAIAVEQAWRLNPKLRDWMPARPKPALRRMSRPD